MKKLIAVGSLLVLCGLTQSLDQRVRRIASEIDATVGVAAMHVESGKRFTFGADERFPIGSVYKLPVAIAFMRGVDEGRLSLSREREEALEAMLTRSDNAAAEMLTRLAGGPDAVAAVAGGAGVDRTTATPSAMLGLLERFYRRQSGLSASSHERLMRIMSSSGAGEHRIKAGAPAQATVANKTGTMRGAINDVGIITSPDGRDHVLIVVFSKGGRSSTLTQRERAVSRITRAIYRDFVGWQPRAETRPR